MSRSFLLLALEDHFGHVTYFVRLRPVNFGLGFRFMAGRAGTAAASLDIGAHTFGLVRFNRTGVRLLLSYTDCGQSIEDFPALNLQFAC